MHFLRNLAAVRDGGTGPQICAGVARMKSGIASSVQNSPRISSGLRLLLDIRPEHTAAVEDLPPLHADPFDRLLLAQARTEPLLLLTQDPQLMAYGHGVIKI